MLRDVPFAVEPIPAFPLARPPRPWFSLAMAVLIACALGVAIGLFLVWVNARSAITIAVAVIRDGHLELTRGGLSPRVLGDLRDIASRPRIANATVRIVRANNRARVEVRGAVSDNQKQQLRNVIGNVHLSQLVGASRR